MSTATRGEWFPDSRARGRATRVEERLDNAIALLKQSEARYRALFEESRHAIYLTDVDGTFVEANPAALRLFGVEAAELRSFNAGDLYVDLDDRRTFQAQIGRNGVVTDFTVNLQRPDGSRMECVLNSSVRLGPDGELLGYQGIIEDVTRRRATERALRASERKFRSLIEHASETITVLAADGTITYESPSLERVLGYRPEDLVGRNVFEYVHEGDRPEAQRAFQQILAFPEEARRVEIRFLHSDGTFRTLEAIGRNLLNDDAVDGIVVNARDITERKRAEEQLVHDAFHDRLTNMPNRALLMDRVFNLLQRTKRADGLDFALLYLEVDRFKVVNESLGHMIGDQLLIEIGQRLRAALRPGDTVARIGGDAFAMILDGADVDEACVVADRIHEQLRSIFRLGRHHVYVTVSIGIANTAGYDYRSAQGMLRDADVAMYRAKESGRARYVVFDESMRQGAVARLQLETDLRQAVDRQQFEVYYQPIIRLDTGNLHGFEALLRWRHGARGLLSPGAFLDTAEETGLIVPIGWWVIEKVCEQLALWSEMQGPFPPPPVQVNVSATQLRRHELVPRIQDAIGLVGAPAELLHLELTESTMMENAEQTVETLTTLKQLGVGLSIDDFGTGYSSLSYLHRFPTDTVKIDRSFVGRMDPMGHDSGIVRTIIDLAHDLGMDVVAEGIENDAQLALLRGMRCEFGQGFRFARPLRAEAATQLVLDRPSW